MQWHWGSCVDYRRQANRWEFEVCLSIVIYIIYDIVFWGLKLCVLLQAEMWGVPIVADWACKWEGRSTNGRDTWWCKASVGREICIIDLGCKPVWIHTWSRPKTHSSSHPSSQGAWVLRSILNFTSQIPTFVVGCVSSHQL